MNGTRPLALLVLVSLLVMAAGSTAFAKTINVPANYKTIQKAIDAAVNGDVVVVAKGRYMENIDFKKKAITVRSTNPTDKTMVAATIIDGQKKGSVVTFKSGEKATSVLTGFTITDGSGTTFVNRTVGRISRYGGGVYCHGSSPTLTNNTISGNSANAHYCGGGGVYCENSSPTLTNNTISGNLAQGLVDAVGGGVCCSGGSPTLTNNTISRNSASYSGGGVCCGDSILTNNTISGNSALTGGGVSCGGNTILTDNTLSSNSATEDGGGVECGGSGSPALTNNIISGNKAGGQYVTGSGGGVDCRDSCSPTLTNNTIRGNSATGDGGGVRCYKTWVILVSNTISGNKAGGEYGNGSGGGVFFDQGFGRTRLTNNTISGNSAGCGGGVDCSHFSSPTLTNNTVSGNSATYGGGVYCQYQSSPVIKNTIIAFGSKGGGLYVDVTLFPSRPSDPVISYCDLYGNTGGDYVNRPQQTGKKGNLSKDPLFADAAKGDFHERSKGGRWNPTTKAWVKDTVQSPCIDAGDPKSPFSQEPKPNGGRINMGAYGNTPSASKSAPAVAAGGLVLTATAAPTGSGLAQVTVNLTSAASVQVTVLNIAGRQVAVLPPQDLSEGLGTLVWDGRSTAGTRAPAGRYLVRVTARGQDGSQAQALAGLSLGR